MMQCVDMGIVDDEIPLSQTTTNKIFDRWALQHNIIMHFTLFIFALFVQTIKLLTFLAPENNYPFFVRFRRPQLDAWNAVEDFVGS